MSPRKEFLVVSDDQRGEGPRGNEEGPMTRALLDGKTVSVSLDRRDSVRSNYSAIAKRHSLQCHTRTDRDNNRFIIWFQERDDAR